MSRTFTWTEVRPTPPAESFGYGIARALAVAYDMDVNDLHCVEFGRDTLPTWRAIHAMASSDDKEALVPIINALENGAIIGVQVQQ